MAAITRPRGTGEAAGGGRPAAVPPGGRGTRRRRATAARSPITAASANQAACSLAVRDHDQGHEQRPDRLAGVAADLEQGLGEAVAAARREPGHARGLGVEDGAADADQRRGQQHGAEAAGERQDQHAEEGRGHAERQREGLRMLVGVEPDQRLQHRGRELEDQRDDADVDEVERQRLLHQRIDRGQHRLHRVVEEMARAHREQDRQHGRARRPRRRRPRCSPPSRYFSQLAPITEAGVARERLPTRRAVTRPPSQKTEPITDRGDR